MQNSELVAESQYPKITRPLPKSELLHYSFITLVFVHKIKSSFRSELDGHPPLTLRFSSVENELDK